MLDLHHLRCALAVARHGTFTRAATALQMSQPGVSMAVRRLESDLGITLFDRHTRGITLTPAGRAVLHAAVRTLESVDALHDATSAVRSLAAGRLRITATGLALDTVVPAIAEFHKAHPHILVRIAYAPNGTEAVQDVVDGTAEIAFSPATEVPNGLGLLPVAREELVAVFPAGQPPNGGPVRLEEFARRPQMVPISGTFSRDLYDAQFRHLAIEPMVSAEYDDLIIGLELVRNGVACMMAPRSRVGRLHSSSLATRRFDPPIFIDVSLVHRLRYLSAAAGAVVQQFGLVPQAATARRHAPRGPVPF